MILGVNGNRLVTPRSGVGRAMESILLGLGEVDHPFSEVRVYTPTPLDGTVKLPACARNIVVPSRLPLGLWEQFVLPRAHGARDLLFCPSYIVPIAARCPLLLVHHGSYEGVREAFPFWRRARHQLMYRVSARRATRISTVSEHSRRHIARFYGVPEKGIAVIPEGVDTGMFKPIADQALLADWRVSILGRDVPFLLYVGKPVKRRNLPNVIAALARLKREHAIPHKLLLIGTDLPGLDLTSEIERWGIAEDVVKVGYATHDDIALAYSACDVLVYPSSYEGFGMPVLEAMACGAPVIAMNNTAFPEFAGGVARLLDDAGVDTMADAIRDLLNDGEERQRMKRDGPLRARAYDWRKVTEQYVGLMREIIAEMPGNGAARA